VRALILTCSAIFAAQLFLDIGFGRYPGDAPGGDAILGTLAYTNHHLLQGWIWLPITYIFLHGYLLHLFLNMVQLYFFGPDVERLLGTRQFLWFFFLCGIGGALANLVPDALVAAHVLPERFGGADYPVVGASGAIMGVIVAFAILDPDRQIFMLPLPFPITARAMVLLLVVINLLSTGGGVSVSTHFGGMITGFAYMKLRPMALRWSWERRGRKARRARERAAGTPKEPATPEEKKLAEAIDNIFRFQDREKH
jgi:membrane associated rhomboid family serine protease